MQLGLYQTILGKLMTFDEGEKLEKGFHHLLRQIQQQVLQAR